MSKLNQDTSGMQFGYRNSQGDLVFRAEADGTVGLKAIKFTDGTVLTTAPANSGTPTVSTPGFFFPSINHIFDIDDPTNVNPAAKQNITQWAIFYLPFNITITRYRFQADGGTWTGGFFYAGLYDVTGKLIFDIGKVDLSLGPGQYGPGAVNDPGTVFFDRSRNPINSVALTAGWYYYGWSAEVATGALVFPQMGMSVLWNEQINVDTVGLVPGGPVKRWAASSLVDAVGGHLPLSISTSGSSAQAPANITFFA